MSKNILPFVYRLTGQYAEKDILIYISNIEDGTCAHIIRGFRTGESTIPLCKLIAREEIRVNYDFIMRYNDTKVHSVLVHELTHMMFAKRLKKGVDVYSPFLIWLNEGIASFAEKEYMMKKNRALFFSERALKNHLTLPQLKQWDSWVIKRQFVSSRRV
jgi:hypothetical protein